MDRIPKGGMCLSVFLILRKQHRRNVLAGKVNAEYDWVRVGALSKETATKVSQGWMRPSSHLLLYESPHDAAHRVLREQLRLEWDDLQSVNFHVFSEAYSKPRHWDIEFVFQGEIRKELPTGNPAWTELKFLRIDTIGASQFARNHQDILAELGVR